MSAARLKSVMESEDKRAIDIASELRISPNTVFKYLRGERVSHSIQALIDRFLESKKSAQGKARTAG
jgi:transcriptional regulator with XRE-family HTH domain